MLCDEKDYIMRMIKEIARVLFSLMLGKSYTQVELEEGNKFQVAGTGLDEYKRMVDEGKVNEAENHLLEDMNYDDKNEVAGAVLFYEYVSEKPEEFLEANNYSKEEAYDGLRQLAHQAGYGEIWEDVYSTLWK